ncbi:MAG: nucleotidyltransferase domain-containing protein [Chloroflexota bacterium]
MLHFDLRTATGVAQIDQTMMCLVDLMDLVFPDRVRGYYLEGSYVDGSANTLSDLDIVVVFKHALSEAESQTFKRLLGACKQISSCALDIAVLGEDALFAVDTADFRDDALLVLTATTLKFASQPVHGDDVRAHIPQVPLDTYTRVLMHFPALVMAGPRGHPQILPFPIESPDPTDQFLGYTGRRLRGRDGRVYPSTKRIVHSTAFIASALLAYHVGQYSPTKRQAMTSYEQHFDDKWAPFLREVHEHCYVR